MELKALAARLGISERCIRAFENAKYCYKTIDLCLLFLAGCDSMSIRRQKARARRNTT